MVFKMFKLDMITLIKCIALIYVSIFYVFSGISISYFVDRYITPPFFPNEENNKKSILKLSSEISIIVGFLVVLSYFTRNIIQLIPFPLDKSFGFNYSDVKEVQSGGILTGMLLTYCLSLESKVKELKSKLNKT